VTAVHTGPPEMRHVVIIGCGRVGSELASGLVAAGHTVAVVDKNPRAFRRLPAGFRQTVTGVGFDRDILLEAGVERAAAVAAVTSGDNSNILTVRVAREVFGVDNVVARIYDPRRAVIYQRLGIATVATVTWTTQQIARRIMPEQAGVEWTDPSGSMQLLERALPARWAGQPLADLTDADHYRILGIIRAGQPRFPTPTLITQDGDILYVVAIADGAEALERRLKTEPEHQP
jgi:trk system potassium uptake protein TrkA